METQVETKVCTHCLKTKPLGDFRMVKSHGCIKRQAVCRICYSLKSKAKKLYSRYNLSLKEYEKLLESHDNKCAICHKPSNLLRIDHDHKTNKVRGLLCHQCNAAIGLFKEDINTIENSIKYLKSW